MAEITQENFEQYVNKSIALPHFFKYKNTKYFILSSYNMNMDGSLRLNGISVRHDGTEHLDAWWGRDDWELYEPEQAAIPEAGTKADNGKPPIGLIPYCALEEAAAAFRFGASKYATFNFTKGIKVTRCLDAAQRHIGQAQWVEDIDQESQVHHLGCAMAEIAMAIFMIKNKPEFDDRYIKQKEASLSKE